MITKAPARATGNRASGTSTQVVALDLGSQTVRAVEVSLTYGSGDDVTARLLRRGQAALPPRAWDDLALNREGVAAAIREALSSAGITGRSVVACLPRRLVTLRFARLPQASPDQLRSMVAMEAQQYILFSLDEVILDYFAIPESPLGGLTGMGRNGADDDLQTILLAAARRSLVADIMAIFDRAGLQLQRLSVSALALAELGARTETPTALVDLEPGEMDVAVVSEGRLLFTRASALDTAGATPDIATRRTAEELARSLTAYQNEFRQKPLGSVYLCGASATGSTGTTLAANLSDLLEAPVENLQSRLMPGADNEALAYATAVGLAAQAQGFGIAPINLVPNERAEKKAAQSLKTRKQLAMLAGVIGVGGVVFWLNGTLNARAAEAEKTKRANARLVEITDSYNVRKKKFDQESGIVSDLSQGLDRRHPSVDVLVALTRCLPPTNNLWLTQYNFDRSGLLTLRGETKSPTAATDLVLAMQSSGAFTQVKLAYLGDAQDTNNGGTGQTAPANQNPAQTPKLNTPNVVTPNVPSLPGLPNTAGGRGGNPATSGAGSPIPQGLPGVNGGQGNFFPGGGGNGPNGFNPNSFGGMSREERRRLRQQRREQDGLNGGVPGGAPPGGGTVAPPNGAVPTNPVPAQPNGGSPPGEAAPATPTGVPIAPPAPNGSGSPPALFFFQPGSRVSSPTVIEPSGARTVAARQGQTTLARQPVRVAGTNGATKKTATMPLTSFVITCRINETSRSLVPANMPMPAPTRQKNTVVKHSETTTINAANESADEEEDPDAE